MARPKELLNGIFLDRLNFQAELSGWVFLKVVVDLQAAIGYNPLMALLKGFVAGLVLIMCIVLTFSYSQSPSQDEIAAWFPAHNLSLPEYDAGKDILYGIGRYGKSRHFVSVTFAPASRDNRAKVNKLKAIPGLRGMPKGASTLDPRNGRYFFIGVREDSERPYVLMVVNCKTGRVIKKHPLKSPIGVLTHNPLNGTLTGMVRATGGGYEWIDMDIHSGKTRVIQKVPRLSRLASRSGIIDETDETGKRFLFLGKIKEQTVLVQCHLQSGKVSFPDTSYVSIDNYRILSWANKKDNKSSPVLCTTSVQSCTGIARYNAELQTGFVVHISHSYRQIPELLATIDNQLKTKYGTGLAGMNPVVLGGRREHDKSFLTVTTVYRQLRKVYGIDIKASRAHHLGKSYTILIENGRVLIF